MELKTIKEFAHKNNLGEGLKFESGLFQLDLDGEFNTIASSLNQLNTKVTLINELLGTVYKVKGSTTVGGINSMTVDNAMVGWVYNLTDSGVITNGIGGELDVVKGDNVVYTENGWDEFSASLDLNQCAGKNISIEDNVISALGYTYDAEKNSFAVGTGTTASGNYSYAEGFETTASGYISHAEGTWTKAKGNSSHAEGSSTIASGSQSHAEGYNTTAAGQASHTEGSGTVASSYYSHSEGQGATTSLTGYNWEVSSKSIVFTSNPSLKIGSILKIENNGEILFVKVTAISEDKLTITVDASIYLECNENSGLSNVTGIAYGDTSHAEGMQTIASGRYSHAEGAYTKASGGNSHVEGYWTITNNNYEHAQGSWNKSNEGATVDQKTLSSIGIGSDANNRKNAQEVMQNGDHYIIGIGEYDGTTITEAQTLQEVINNKIDKEDNKGLSTEDYTTEEKEKLSNIEIGAQVNTVNSVNGQTGDVIIELLTSGNNINIENNSISANGYSYNEDINAISIALSEPTSGSFVNYLLTDSEKENYVNLNEQPDYLATGVFGTYFEVYEDSEYKTKISDAIVLGISTSINRMGSKFKLVLGSLEEGVTYYYKFIYGAYGLDSSSLGVNYSLGLKSHSVGSLTSALGFGSHSEGSQTLAYGSSSHAEGSGSISIGSGSHAEGYSTIAGKTAAHAEGLASIASGVCSHVEGFLNRAVGLYSHALGESTIALGRSSHTEGGYTQTTNWYEHALGVRNKSNIGTIHSIGIGNSDLLKNAQEVMNSGDHYVIGIGNYDGTNPSEAQTVQEVVNSKVDKEEGKTLTTNDYTTEDKEKLTGIEAGAQVNEVTSVNNMKGDVTIVTNQAFPESFNISGTTLEFAQSINLESTAINGMTYLGGVSLSDLPETLVNAECLVQVIASAGDGSKVIHFDLYSADTQPYHWSCMYYNSSVTDWVSYVTSEDLASIIESLEQEINLLKEKVNSKEYSIDFESDSTTAQEINLMDSVSLKKLVGYNITSVNVQIGTESAVNLALTDNVWEGDPITINQGERILWSVIKLDESASAVLGIYETKIL